MRPTLFRRAQFGTGSDGYGGVHPWQTRPDYGVYRSKFGPQYKITPHVHGLNSRLAIRYGIMTSLFGVAGGFFVLFLLGEVPRIREDIWSHVPIIGGYFRRETPPEDNPFG